MLLPLVGETDRRRHLGCRVTASLLDEPPGRDARTFVQSPDGQTTLPVRVDHAGSAGTRYAAGTPAVFIWLAADLTVMT